MAHCDFSSSFKLSEVNPFHNITFIVLSFFSTYFTFICVDGNKSAAQLTYGHKNKSIVTIKKKN